MAVWLCTKTTLSPYGWVQPGRTAEDGDPMLEQMNPECWERVTADGSPVKVVEEATAEPGKTRRTSRMRGRKDGDG